MNKIDRPIATAGYDEDLARWALDQTRLIRANRLDALDLENVRAADAQRYFLF